MYKILILTDSPVKNYEKLCFNTLRYYSEKNNYDLMLRDEYYYDNDYDYLFYISNNCLILDVDIRIEYYINERHELQTYTDLKLNYKDFLIIRNDEKNSSEIRNFVNIDKLIFRLNKNISFLSFIDLPVDIISNYKNPNFLKYFKNPFFFIYGEYERTEMLLGLNDVILDFIYNQLFNIFYFKKEYIQNNINLNQYDYTQEIEIFNPNKKIAFVTNYSFNIKEQGIQSEFNIKKYCEKNNYTYYIHRKSDIGKEKFPSVEKVYLLKKYIDNHDYIIWVDPDILIFDMEFKIESLLKDNISLYCYKDINYYLNNGFLIFKNDDISKNILKEWLELIENKNVIDYNDSYIAVQDILIDVITKKYLKNIYRSTTMEINVPLSYLNKKSKILHINGFYGFFRYLLLEYFNYVVFNIKYKELLL